MPKIKGTKTQVNILTAFAGEAQAHMRYIFFSSKAKKDGYVQISKLFAETADQEKEHAERLFKFLDGGQAVVNAPYPAGIIGTTLENLMEAAGGENHEYAHMYPDFAKVADKEGFPEIAAAMRNIAIAEMHHEERFLKLAKELKEGTIFKKHVEIEWECLNCGYMYKGKDALELCPACAHPRDHFAPRRGWKAH